MGRGKVNKAAAKQKGKEKTSFLEVIKMVTWFSGILLWFPVTVLFFCVFVWRDRPILALLTFLSIFVFYVISQVLPEKSVWFDIFPIGIAVGSPFAIYFTMG